MDPDEETQSPKKPPKKTILPLSSTIINFIIKANATNASSPAPSLSLLAGVALAKRKVAFKKGDLIGWILGSKFSLI